MNEVEDISLDEGGSVAIGGGGGNTEGGNGVITQEEDWDYLYVQNKKV